MDEQSPSKINTNNTLYKVFLGLIIFFVSFGWLTLFFAAIGLFYAGTVVLSLLIGLAGAFFLLRPSLGTGAGLRTCVVAFSLLVSFATCYFATPTVFGGRDQGAISTAAINLAKNHRLEFSTPASQDLFKKYGVGKALNFPGFDYASDGKLISRFPIGYTSYLAASYALFGLKGIQYANFFPLFLFLIIFWLILNEFFSEKISLAGYLVAATFFPFLWFAKYTLTETYALFLVWAGIFFFVRYLNEKNSRFLVFSLFSLGLSALVRVEGLAFFALAIVYIFILQKKNAVKTPKNFYKYLIFSALFLFVIYILLNSHSLFDGLKNIAKSYLPVAGTPNPARSTFARLFIIFFNYNLLPYLFLGLGGLIALFAKGRKAWPKPEFLIIFLTFPAFFYLFSPMVTLDDPWMLRRFSFAVFPALIFYGIYFLKNFLRWEKIIFAIFVLLIISNIAVSGFFLTKAENKDLLPQIGKISQNFGSNDLVLVDRLATGNGFSLMSDPLRTTYGKNAVYFFNAEDLGYINRNFYENVYLIAPLESERETWYANLRKELTNTAEIRNNYLAPSEGLVGLAEDQKAQAQIGIWKIIN